MEREEHQTGITNMWIEFNKDGTTESLYQLNNGSIEGVLGVCIVNQDKTMDYWVATAHEGNATKEFEKMTIPKATWAIFKVHGRMPLAIQKVWKQIYSEWFPSSGYEHANAPQLEVYPNEDPYSDDYQCEIWIPVK